MKVIGGLGSNDRLVALVALSERKPEDSQTVLKVNSKMNGNNM